MGPTTSLCAFPACPDCHADPGRPVRHVLRHPVWPAQPARQGLYLAVATLAAQFFSDWMFLRIQWLTNDSPSAPCRSPSSGAGHGARHPDGALPVLPDAVGVIALLAKNLVRGAIGREWMAIRDMDVAAAVIGIRPMYAKLSATFASAPSSSVWPVRCGPSFTWARGGRRRSRSKCPSGCCSW